MPTLRLVSGMTGVVVALLVASSVAGLRFGTSGWYDANPATLPAFVGQDLMTLLFAVPLLVVSSTLARRGSLRAMLWWMGALFYVAYSYYFHVIGGRFNAFFPVYIALVSMGTYGALAILFAIDLERLPAAFARAPVRLVSAYLIVTALGFAGLWLSILDTHYVIGTAIDPVARAVIAIDGVVLLPLLFYAGRALARREPIGFALAGLLLVKALATFLTLLVNVAVARSWGQPVDVVQASAYAAGFAGAAALVVYYFRSTEAAPA